MSKTNGIGGRRQAKVKRPKIAVAALGHYIYFEQFQGLFEELNQKAERFVGFLKSSGIDADIYYAGYADNVEKAFECAGKIRREAPELLFLLMTTYVPSSVAASIACNIDAPAVLVGIQPLSKLNYSETTTYTQLANDDICAMPEVAGVFSRMRKPLAGCIVDCEEDSRWKSEVCEWMRAASAKSAFRYAQIGCLGHTYEGMYDMHTDPTAFTAAFGAHVKMLEICELVRYCHECGESEISAKIDVIRSVFDICDPSVDPLTDHVAPDDLRLAALTSCALDRLIEVNRLTALAYYYKGEPGTEYERIAANLIIGNTLLTSAGIPLAGEADLKTAAAMLIMNRIGGGGTFAEIHPFSVRDDIVMVGHDGPHNTAISDGRPKLRKLRKYHGKSGSGIGVEFSIRTGPVTLLSIGVNPDGSFRMVAAEGEALPGEIPQTGNTNTRVGFGEDIAAFLEKWCLAAPTHHFALGTGHRLGIIKKYSALTEIQLVTI